jgi:hypothetical protein
MPITDGRGNRASILATEKAAKLPKAEDRGHEQEDENRERGECGYRDDNPFHAVSVPRGLRD